MSEGRTDEVELVEEVLHVRRCTKVVKGGRRFSFSALVVVGDQMGRVGLGFGKANVVSQSIEKARNKAAENMKKISLANETIPHEVKGRALATKIIMRPASPGTGVIAGAVARAICECVGITNILTKVIGNKNPLNVAHATMNGLLSLRTKEMIAQLRGVEL
jgi:small subunit ribosomal protein S5